MECRLVAHSANYRERMRALMKTHNLNSKHDSIRARSMNSQLRRSVLPRTLYARTTRMSHQGVNLRSKSKLQAAYVWVQPLIALGCCRVAPGTRAGGVQASAWGEGDGEWWEGADEPITRPRGIRSAARSGPGARRGPACTGIPAGTSAGRVVPAGSSCTSAGMGAHTPCSLNRGDSASLRIL